MSHTLQDHNSTINTEYNVEQFISVPLLRENTESIIYIKTLKTASSTITNLLHSYTVRHNKSCLIITTENRHKPFFGFNFDKRKDLQFVSTSISNRHTWNGHNAIDIWLNHVTYHPYLFELIPSANKQIVSIVRRPDERLLSELYYFKWRNDYNNMSKYISAHINGVDNTLSVQKMNSMCSKLIAHFVETKLTFEKYNSWEQIISGNMLLLIKERFDESIVLLKYAYNLSWSDLYFSTMKISNQKNKYKLTRSDKFHLKTMLQCDWKLYNMASKIFDYRLYEIYRGNKTKLNMDINIMKEYQYKQQKICDSIIGKNYTNTDPMYIEMLVCQSVQLDNPAWNAWAENIKKRHQIW